MKFRNFKDEKHSLLQISRIYYQFQIFLIFNAIYWLYYYSISGTVITDTDLMWDSS